MGVRRDWSSSMLIRKESIRTGSQDTGSSPRLGLFTRGIIYKKTSSPPCVLRLAPSPRSSSRDSRDSVLYWFRESACALAQFLVPGDDVSAVKRKAFLYSRKGVVWGYFPWIFCHHSCLPFKRKGKASSFNESRHYGMRHQIRVRYIILFPTSPFFSFASKRKRQIIVLMSRDSVIFPGKLVIILYNISNLFLYVCLFLHFFKLIFNFNILLKCLKFAYLRKD